ncbi:MAG: DNA-directed RNA polymerase [Desulfurococcaceae archaeon]|nr:DNA-directed RNA polymerase [Desulfurococcaceae archaeon]
MFRIYEIEDYIKISPDKYGEDVNKIAEEILREEYENKFFKDLGIVLLVYDIKINEMGMIIIGEGSTYHEARFKILTFMPVVNEVVEGVVRDVRNIGLFVDIGPLDALVHISQVMEDKAYYDEASGRIVSEDGRKFIEKGDIVRGRITSISLPSGREGVMRIAMTLRQAGLGKIEKPEMRKR